MSVLASTGYSFAWPGGVVLSNRKITLLSRASATGAKVYWPGGRGVFKTGRTFGGATVTLEFEETNGDFSSVGIDAEHSAPGVAGFELPPCFIRASVTGGSGQDIDAEVERVKLT